MKMKSITILAALLLPMPALAGDDHTMNGEMHGHGMQSAGKGMEQTQAGMQGMFLVKKQIDGYTVSFHVMKASEGMRHGGAFNFMVKIEQDGKPANVIAVNSKVRHPDGQEESKMMMKMGDWHMAGYDLGHPGQHQLMVLFKTDDDKKHFTGVWYPEK